MKRGDIVTVSATGDYGKPRPAVVVQSDYLIGAGLESVIVCLITADSENAPIFRLNVRPTPSNGLKKPSQIMVDKIVAVRATRIGKIIGRLDDQNLLRLNRTIAFVTGLAE